ncbi:MAG: methylmalonyl Co-A mutase-associated GTPase MeaB [Rhodospirillaceae bacterium]|jgi:LAO/AO transport system kinase|nr:methylmalonyl Co-A mutase-associated GTPase MeaB [Rhodospirillaceae bacterium]MBT5751815.1 methylmalonyl Co-A mutase-associated GTPase MeaB [Rhodospirillaceae bacterium]
MAEKSGTKDKTEKVEMETLAGSVLKGDRRALARAITLIESTRPDHRRQSEILMGHLLPHAGKSVRIGISGVPGVGKSTFIETFGLHVIGQGHKVAVLAVDPSSKRSGGSILGDKTRMTGLSQSKDAFIRPSPSGGALGGVAARTREALLACEAAGFDVVFVETVGVGQSETAVADMVDTFLLLLLPSGGDELQGIKKGIMEIADLLAVNKADGDLIKAAGRTASDYGNAVRLIRPAYAEWQPRVQTCSALKGEGIPEIWQAVLAFRDAREESGGFSAHRAEQAKTWLWSEVNLSLAAAFRGHGQVSKLIGKMEKRVVAGEITPTAAAQALLDVFLQGK